jgi:hypothetical protein
LLLQAIDVFKIGSTALLRCWILFVHNI